MTIGELMGEISVLRTRKEIIERRLALFDDADLEQGWKNSADALLELEVRFLAASGMAAVTT